MKWAPPAPAPWQHRAICLSLLFASECISPFAQLLSFADITTQYVLTLWTEELQLCRNPSVLQYQLQWQRPPVLMTGQLPSSRPFKKAASFEESSPAALGCKAFSWITSYGIDSVNSVSPESPAQFNHPRGWVASGGFGTQVSCRADFSLIAMLCSAIQLMPPMGKSWGRLQTL